MNAPAIPGWAIGAFHKLETLDMAHVQANGNALYRFCLHHARLSTRNYERAKEIATIALAKAYGKRAQFRGGASVPKFYAWLRQIVRNTTRDFFRREYARHDRYELTPELVNFIAANTPSPEEKLTLYGLLQACAAEVLGPQAESCLSELEQNAIRLTAWRELDNKEAAGELRVNTKDFENALYRARQKLHEKLQAIGWLEQGERIIKDRLAYGFAPDSGQRRARPHIGDQ